MHQAAARFDVAISTAIDWVNRHHRTGNVAPGQMGGHWSKKLVGKYRGWLLRRCRESDFTLRGLVAELAEQGLGDVAVGGAQRHGDAEAATHFSAGAHGDERSKVGGSSAGGPNIAGSSNGRGTGLKGSGRGPGNFRRIHTVMRLKPDAVTSKKPMIEMVVRGLSRGIENFLAPEPGQAQGFAVRGHDGSGSRNAREPARLSGCQL